MSGTPAADLTRAHVGHWVTIHRPGRDDTVGVLNSVTHGPGHTAAAVAVWTADRRNPTGGRFQTSYFHDDPGPVHAETFTVTVGDRWVGPGETSTAKPERSRDYAADLINSPRD